MTIPEREAAAILQTYRRVPVTFIRGGGSWLYDETAKAYLDCLAGIAGRCRSDMPTRRWPAAVAKQMTELVHVSNLYFTEPQVTLAERLKALTGLDRVFFSNDGATANETAIKLARRWGQKQRGSDCYEIVSLTNSFHGRTLASLAATGQPAKQATFAPLPTGFAQIAAGQIGGHGGGGRRDHGRGNGRDDPGRGRRHPLRRRVPAVGAGTVRRAPGADDCRRHPGRSRADGFMVFVGRPRIHPRHRHRRQGACQRASDWRLRVDRTGGGVRVRRSRHDLRWWSGRVCRGAGGARRDRIQ